MPTNGIQELIKTNGTFSDALGGLGGLLIYGVILLTLATTTLREQD